MKPEILIVDDDPHIRGVIRIAAENAGMNTAEAAGGQQALDMLRQLKPDLIVLDIGMPVMNGFHCCQRIRATSRVPILFLTAHDEEIDRVLGFELGADDYVTKPFSPRELVLRIRAILGRGGSRREEILRHGDVHLDGQGHVCRIGGRELPLTAREFTVLATLLRHPEKLISRNAMIQEIYGRNTALSGRTIDSHVRNIRAKAAALDCRDIIRTIRGVGLRLGSCRLEQDAL
ncbi:response regulator transcription factor [Roseibium sp.]|uniref:response regulator transcription factor n=1 Tax=Roseibium sp. TaxID=1936156 RepID=UPI00326544ED